MVGRAWPRHGPCGRPLNSVVRHHMSDGASNRVMNWLRSNWILLPFVEQLFVVAVFLLIGPGAWGAYLIARGSWSTGAAVLLAWILVYGLVAYVLNRNSVIRLWISVPSAALVVVATFIAFRVP